jgi:guanylate kinase
MSSLITIKNNKLWYNLKNITEDTTTPVKIISVIGKARTGKSTLMNLLISKWSNSNTTVFKMNDTGDHCTNGVDYYYIKHLNIILLDFQGIYLGDSSQDSKLLLLAYLLSDVIIFNENKMLSNNTLSQFEPMLSFIQYMHKDDFKKSNPKLIFRITDVNLNIDATTNMHQMLTKQNDQFQSIRDCINELFDEPFAINTNNLDRSEFKLLKKEDFMGILNENENGFNNAINKINDYLSCCTAQRTFGSFINDTRCIVMAINNNGHINFHELDVLSNLSIRNILDYILKIDQSMYSEIVVDGTQKLYEDNLVSRITKRDEIIQEIYKKFKAIPKNIIEKELPKFTDKVNPLIEKAIMENKLKAIELIQENIKKYIPQHINKIYCFGTDPDYNTWIKPLQLTFKQLTVDSSHIYKEIYDIFTKNKDNIFTIIKKKFEEEKEIEDECVAGLQIEYEEYVSNVDNNIIDFIHEHFDIEVHDKVDAYYNGIINISSKHIDDELIDNNDAKKYVFKLIIYNDKIFNLKDNSKSVKTEADILSNISKPGLRRSPRRVDDESDELDKLDKLDTQPNISATCAKMCEEYKNKVKGVIEKHKDTIYKMLNEHREKMLTDKKGKINNINTDISGNKIDVNTIIVNNPSINFVCFTLNNVEYLMTQHYFDSTLKKDFGFITQKCIDEGYQNDWGKFMKEITTIKITEKTKVFNINFDEYKNICKDNYRKLVLFELFELEFKKHFARNKFTFEF